MNNESVGKKIVEALKKQAEIIDTPAEEEAFSFEMTQEAPVHPEDVFEIKQELLYFLKMSRWTWNLRQSLKMLPHFTRLKILNSQCHNQILFLLLSIVFLMYR